MNLPKATKGKSERSSKTGKKIAKKIKELKKTKPRMLIAPGVIKIENQFYFLDQVDLALKIAKMLKIKSIDVDAAGIGEFFVYQIPIRSKKTIRTVPIYPLKIKKKTKNR